MSNSNAAALSPGASPTIRSVLTVGALALAHTAADAATNVLPALLPALQLRFGLRDAALTALMATLHFSVSISQPWFGFMADRIGRRLVLIAGLTVAIGIFSLIAASSSVAVLFAVLVIGGIGSAALHPSGASLARESARTRSEVGVSMFTFGGTVGVAIAPFLALLMARQLAPIPVLLPAGLGMMLVAVLWALLPADRQPQTAGPTVTKRVSSSRWLLLRGPIGRITIVQSTASLGALTFVGTMPMHLVRTTGLAVDSALISWTLALFSVASATGGVVASALARRIAPRYLVPVAMLLALAPLVASYLLTTTHVPFFIAVALAGALLHAGLPMLVVRAQNLAAGSTSAASGMVLGLAAAAAAVGYLALGGLQSVVGSSTVMALGFAPVIGGAFLARTVLGGRSRVRNLRARRRLPA